jgi:hypothetical protein
MVCKACELTDWWPGRRTGSQCTCVAGCQGPYLECAPPEQGLDRQDKQDGQIGSVRFGGT